MTSKGKKTLILSDSTCGRIDMKDFNQCVNEGVAYRKYYPGATPQEMGNYCTHVLEAETPDAVIIHAGTNSLYKDDVDTIVSNVLKIAEKCKLYGVNNVFISGITYRQQFQGKVELFNKFFTAKQYVSSIYTFIPNNNICAADIWSDRVHLNNKGVIKLANNFINAINGAHSL